MASKKIYKNKGGRLAFLNSIFDVNLDWRVSLPFPFDNKNNFHVQHNLETSIFSTYVDI